MAEQTTFGTPQATLRWLTRVPIDPMTYRSLGYLLLAFPLGIAYFVILTVGFSLSIGLSVILVGPLILVGTLLTVLALAWFDGVMTQAVLGAEVSPHFPRNESLSAFLKDLFLGPATWLGLFFLLWKVALGFVAIVLIPVGLVVGIVFMTSPLFYGEYVFVQYGFGTAQIASFADAMILALIGFFITYATLVCINLLGLVSRAIAEGMLQHDSLP